MKIFKKRKPLKDDALKRVPFEDIVEEVFLRYKDNVICSEDTRKAIVKEITLRIREQLPKV